MSLMVTGTQARAGTLWGMEKRSLKMAAYYMNRNGEFKLSLFCNDPKKPRSSRGTCGAKTRRSTACKAPPVWDKVHDKARNGRCKLHGGLSTGAKTELGREAIRESNRRRRKNIKQGRCS